MNLNDSISISAETMVKDSKTTLSRKLNPLLLAHYNNVQKVVKGIKDSGDIIQLSNQAQLVGREDDKDKVYQTVIFHGMTRSAEKKTFIRTKNDGSVEQWTESVA